MTSTAPIYAQFAQGPNVNYVVENPDSLPSLHELQRLLFDKDSLILFLENEVNVLEGEIKQNYQNFSRRLNEIESLLKNSSQLKLNINHPPPPMIPPPTQTQHMTSDFPPPAGIQNAPVNMDLYKLHKRNFSLTETESDHQRQDLLEKANSVDDIQGVEQNNSPEDDTPSVDIESEFDRMVREKEDGRYEGTDISKEKEGVSPVVDLTKYIQEQANANDDNGIY